MKCTKCEAELTENAKFCSYCGSKVTDNPPEIPKTEEKPIKAEPSIEPVREESPVVAGLNATIGESTSKPTLDRIIKDKLLVFWNGLDLFCRISTISISIIAILLLTSIIAGKGFAILFSILQLTGLVVAVLMHKGVIKLDANKTWIKFLVLAIAILLTVLNIMSYSWEQGSFQSTDPNDDSIETASVVTVTAPYGTAECLGQDYSTIKSYFNSAGFTSVKIEKIEDLEPSESDKVNTVESISVDGNAEFEKGQYFNSNDVVIIRYHAYKACKLTIHVDFTKNLIFSTYNVKLLLNGIEKGTMEHGSCKDFELSVDPGEYTLTFENVESSSVKGEVALTVDCNIDAAYKIYCYSDEVSVETVYVDRLVELAEGEVKLDVAASEYNFKNYTEVETALKVLGFTNIKYEVLYDIIFGITEEGEVESVSIAGNKNFKKSDVFASDAEIIITYHMKVEDDPNRPVESEPTEPKTEEPTEPELKLTIDNCPELAAMLSNKADRDESYSTFATMYKGRIIEFDGSIVYCTHHGDYKTRFDYLLSAGDYDPNHQTGPTFKFEDVNYYDLNTDLGVVSVGHNVHIVAEVISFDSDCGIFYLDPIAVTGR